MALPILLLGETARIARAARRRVRRPAACCVPGATRRRSAGVSTIDLALDGEQRVDAGDRLDADRRLVQSHQVEEVAPRMGPAGDLDDRPRLAAGS